jgi:uncharacterized membrane protein
VTTAPALGDRPSDEVAGGRYGPALRARARAFAGADRAWAVLVVLVLWWIATFGQLVWRRHARFGSFAFDMGIYGQGVWLLGHGRMFDTVRGLPILGHHVNLNLVLLAPFTWFGAGPAFLNIFQVISLGLGAVPLWLLARHRFRSGWIALVFPVAYLAHPSVQSFAWELFHPDVLAITPLFAAWYCLVTKRRGWAIAFLVYAAAWKEDVALFIVMLGVVLADRDGRRRRPGGWRFGAGVAVSGVAWFVICTRVILPGLNHVGPFYDEFFGDLGDSPAAIAKTTVTDPGKVWDHLDAADWDHYVRGIVGPFGYTPLAAPAIAVLGLPQLGINLLASQYFVYDLRYHYVALPLTAAALASVEGVAWLARRARRYARVVTVVCAAVVLVSALGATHAKGLTEFGARYDDGYWPADHDPRQAVYQQALALIPPDATVSASSRFLTHLTHRPEIYFFPNPFQSRYWGVHGEDARSGDRVDWLAIDRHQFEQPVPDGDLLDSLLAHDFEVVYARDDVVVAHRRGT